ncbi:hypothetical protein JCM8097_006633 [Rhodosporidiobolus ruineniae]
MSLPSLPYELLSHLASSLAAPPPAPPSFFEAPSASLARRQVGRTLALAVNSPAARLVGRELVWRRVVVGFHRNPDLLRRIQHERWMAEHVRQLVVVCGTRKAMDLALSLSSEEENALDLAAVVPLFPALESLHLAAPPPVLERFFARVIEASALANLAHLELNSTFGPSATWPETLLELLPHFSGVRYLTLGLNLPADTAFSLPAPPSSSRPRLRPHTLALTLERTPPPSYHLISTFLSLLTALLSPSSLRSLSFHAPYLSPSSLSALLPSPSSSADPSALENLTLSLPVGPLLSRFPALLPLLSSLERLKRLKLLVHPHTAAPLILPASHPLRAGLLEALPASLEEVELDFDLMSPSLPSSQLALGPPAPPDVLAFLNARLEEGKPLRSWTTVEWEEAMGIRRAVTVVRQTGKDGRERWVPEWAGEGAEEDEVDRT